MKIKNPSPDDLPEGACGHYTLIDNPELKPKYEIIESVIDGRRIQQVSVLETKAEALDEDAIIAIPHYFTYDDCPRCNSEEV